MFVIIVHLLFVYIIILSRFYYPWAFPPPFMFFRFHFMYFYFFIWTHFLFRFSKKNLLFRNTYWIYDDEAMNTQTTQPSHIVKLKTKSVKALNKRLMAWSIPIRYSVKMNFHFKYSCQIRSCKKRIFAI